MIKCPKCEAVANFVGIRYVDNKPHNRYECSNCDHKFLKTSEQEYEESLKQFALRESLRLPSKPT